MSMFLLQNAQRLHQAGNLAEAARLYGEVLRINPQQFEALYGLVPELQDAQKRACRR